MVKFRGNGVNFRVFNLMFLLYDAFCNWTRADNIVAVSKNGKQNFYISSNSKKQN